MSDIRVGDIVRLNSGGPKMTVDAIQSGAAHVKWVNDLGTLDGTVLNVAALTKVADTDVAITVSVDSDGVRESLREITAMIEGEAAKWAAAAEGKLSDRVLDSCLNALFASR